MAPKSYIQKRESGEDLAWIDDRPYCPTLQVDCNDLSSIRQAAARIVLPNNNSSDWTKLSVEQISGGITNTLFQVSGLRSQLISFDSNNSTDNNDIPDACLVRVFGAEGMIDRDVENSTYAALDQQNMSPPYWGRFANGRIEGWMQDMRPLQVREMANPEISKRIAQAMARLHCDFQIPSHLQDYYKMDEPSMWKQLHSWFQQAIHSTFHSQHDTMRAQALRLSNIQDELDWLQSSVCPANAAVAFCHNETTQQIQLIDFEYGGMNYCSFDIANHLNEFAGGTDTGIPHYEWLPSLEDRRAFIQTYLTTAQHGKSLPSETAIEKMLEEVQAFVLANHLYWGLWAVNQAAMEGCHDFDYLLYATNRFQQYQVCKQEWQERHTQSSTVNK